MLDMDITFTVTPNSGYEIEAVYINGEDIGAVENYTFTYSEEEQSISVTFRKQEPKNPFKDIYETDIYFDAVKFVTENGIMDGISANKFRPKASMKRGEFIAVLGRAAGIGGDYSYSGEFTDVDSSDECAPYIAWAVENGIVNGYGNGRFGKNDRITYEQCIVIMLRYLNFCGYGIDMSDMDSAFETASEMGIIADGAADLTDYASRVDIAMMIYACFAAVSVNG